MENEKTLNINWDFILKVSVLIIFLYFLYLIQDIAIWFIFALVVAILFNFLINFLEDKKIPRVLAAVFVYLAVLSLLGFFFYKTAPLFLREIKQFSTNLPFYLKEISPYLEKLGINILQSPDSIFRVLERNLEKIGGSALNALVVIFGGMQAAIFIGFLAFFLSLERNILESFLANFAPSRYKDYLFNLLPRVRKRVSGWFLSRVMGVLFVGILTYLVLSILNVKYAFILAVFFGVLDFIPIIGPIIGGAIVVILVMLNSVTQALFVLIGLVIVQQLENNLLFPLLFKRFIGLPPSLVLIALAIGAKLWGFLGAILAIPLAGVIFEFIKDYLKFKKKSEAENKTKQEIKQKEEGTEELLS
jgi:predicted PurR-regulated permease PerM